MSLSPSVQFDRVANLTVANTSLGTGRDLSQMHFKFKTEQNDDQQPNTLTVTIFNLNDETENEIIQQYDSIALQVGYRGLGPQVIFTGSIKMFRRGKSSATDKFLEISAADNDLGYSYGLLNASLAAGASQGDVLTAAGQAMGVSIDKGSTDLVQTGGVIYPRGKVMFGLARAQLGKVADTINARWSVDAVTGKLTYIPLTSYLQTSQAVVLNPTTGLIGVPEDTPDGINIKCLLNPQMKVGCAVQIDSADLVTIQPSVSGALPGGGILYPGYRSVVYPAIFQRGIGFYRILVIEHEGDTRELEWYSNLTCLLIDQTAPVDSSVQAGG